MFFNLTHLNKRMAENTTNFSIQSKKQTILKTNVFFFYTVCYSHPERCYKHLFVKFRNKRLLIHPWKYQNYPHSYVKWEFFFFFQGLKQPHHSFYRAWYLGPLILRYKLILQDAAAKREDPLIPPPVHSKKWGNINILRTPNLKKKN